VPASGSGGGSSSNSGGGGGGDGMSPWFHGPIKKTEADALLEAGGGFSNSGKFLIRQKGSSTNDFILSVVYKGAGTHHVLNRESDGAELLLNKTGTGCTTIAEVVEKYRSKQPKWPVPLTDGVPA
jgi:hypothetical protein